MSLIKKWFYDYENKCDCADDDRCGCTYPNNMKRNFDYVTEFIEDTKHPMQNKIHIGGKAPNFVAPAILADNLTDREFNFYDFIDGSYAVLLFYPADFSSLCPHELIMFDKFLDEFHKLNVKLVAVSVDSVNSHLAWKKMNVIEGGVGNIKIPLVSDICKSISFDYGILNANGLSARGFFVIDKDYRIRCQVITDDNVEHNVEECMRIIKELQLTKQNKNDCSLNYVEQNNSSYNVVSGISDSGDI